MEAMSPQQDALGGQPGRSSSLTGMSRIAGGPGTKKVRTPSGVPPTGARLPRVPGAGRGLTVPRGAGGGAGGVTSRNPPLSLWWKPVSEKPLASHRSLSTSDPGGASPPGPRGGLDLAAWRKV